jgi:hypothetical protein
MMVSELLSLSSSSDCESSRHHEYEGFENEGFLELSEIGHCLSLDFATPQNTGKVFRDGQISLDEEVMMVLKRANPVIEGNDENDPIESPIAKRYRMNSLVFTENTKVDYHESDEATLTSESTEDYEGNQEFIDFLYTGVAKPHTLVDTLSSTSLIILTSHSK